MHSDGILSHYQIKVGGLLISSTVINTWILMLMLGAISWLLTRSLSSTPSTLQLILESSVTTMRDAVSEVLPDHTDLVFPFISTLWIFILFANLMGVIPGLSSPTTDLSVTSSLAILTFLSVHWYGIQSEGFRRYFKHYLQPTPFLLPFHLMSEISRTIALALRLFGNIMSLEFTTLLILWIAGFLVPIPILMLHIIEAIIQAYIFGVLALMYIASGIQVQILRRDKEENKENS